jgi:hypothetical protein
MSAPIVKKGISIRLEHLVGAKSRILGDISCLTVSMLSNECP